MLRAGMVIVHALARRVRDFDLEVFFLGTATVPQCYTLPGNLPPHALSPAATEAREASRGEPR